MAGKTIRLMAGAGLMALLAACGERELILQGERFPIRAPLEASVPVEGEPTPAAPRHRGGDALSRDCPSR
ncbi:MAG: hypothetical protein HC844_15825 [Tabrizicola sp.]|nr:hypothetical protein [Tabrizicola sp.]